MSYFDENGYIDFSGPSYDPDYDYNDEFNRDDFESDYWEADESQFGFDHIPDGYYIDDEDEYYDEIVPEYETEYDDDLEDIMEYSPAATLEIYGLNKKDTERNSKDVSETEYLERLRAEAEDERHRELELGEEYKQLQRYKKEASAQFIEPNQKYERNAIYLESDDDDDIIAAFERKKYEDDGIEEAVRLYQERRLREALEELQ